MALFYIKQFHHLQSAKPPVHLFKTKRFYFEVLFPKRSVSFRAKSNGHSNGLLTLFECRSFITFCDEKVSAQVVSLVLFP